MKREHKEEMKRRARNICLIVAYDGTGYHGFQRQTKPVVAVQNVLEESLSSVRRGGRTRAFTQRGRS